MSEKAALDSIKSSSSINPVEQLYANLIENTYFKSPVIADTYKNPYNPDDLYQKTFDYSTYEKMVTDDQVSVCLKLKKDLILGDGGQIISTEENQDEIIEDIEQALFKDYEGSFNDDLEEILTAYEFGVSLTEKIYKLRPDNSLALKCLKTRHPNAWLLYQDDKGHVTKYEQRTSAGNISVDHRTLIHFINDKRFQNPYGNSDLRPAYNAWFTKMHITRFFSIFLEKAASPIPVGTYNKNAPPGVADKILQVLQRFQTKTAITIPEDVKVEFLEAKNNGDVYHKAIHLFNMIIGRSLFVPDLVGFTGSETGGGSLALGKEQMNLFFKHIIRRRNSLEDVINKEIIAPIIQYNWGFVENPPKFKFKPIDDTAAVDLAKTWLEAVKGNVYQANEEEINHFRKLVKFPEGEVTFKSQAPAGPITPNDPNQETPDEINEDGQESEDIQDVSRFGSDIIKKEYGGPGSGPQGGSSEGESESKGKAKTKGKGKSSSKSGGGEPSPDEAKAIGTYTGSSSAAMMAADRGEKVDDFVKERNDKLNNYLDKAPKYEGSIHRGLSVEAHESEAVLEKFKPGSTISLDSKQSWTKDPKAVDDRLKQVANSQKKPTSIMFEYPSSNVGVDISKHSRFPEEAEVLVPKGSKYRVKEVKKEGKGYRVIMEHADSKNHSTEESKEFAKAYDSTPGDYSKKVNFKAMKTKLDDYDNSVMNDTSKIVKKMLTDLFDQIERKKILQSQNTERIDTLSLKYKKELKQVLKSSFMQLYLDSKSQAQTEIQKSDFAKPLMQDKFLEVIEDETFKFVGDYEYTILKKARVELIAAVKDGRPLSSVMGILDADLKQLSDVALERFARTKHTEVMNNARVEYFDSTGVVTGYQYSAILDDRTSDICNGLHGKFFKAGTEPVPPMHFNCRSTLIPITKYEQFKPTESIQGQSVDKFIDENKGSGFSKYSLNKDFKIEIIDDNEVSKPSIEDDGVEVETLFDSNKETIKYSLNNKVFQETYIIYEDDQRQKIISLKHKKINNE